LVDKVRYASVDAIVDVNVNLSRWPTRRIRGDDTAELVAKLRRHGVVEAWTGSFDALLHKDIAAVNARLVRECRAQSAVRLVPFGSVNPLLPDWEEGLRRCAEDHRMPGIRLHPGHPGYSLHQPPLGRLLELAARRRLLVCLALEMEDERMMNPLMRAPAVDPKPLAALIARTPGVRLVLLNALRALRGAALLDMVRAGE